MNKAAKVLKHHKGDVMRLWKENVREAVKGAEYSNDMVLLNHLPDLLDDIIELLESSKNLEEMLEKDKNNHLFQMSREHGRHRSASYGYSIDQVIYEYILFHQTISDLLILENAFSHEVSKVVKYAIETSMMFASEAFNSSIKEMRQKLIRLLAHDIRNPIFSALLGIDMINQDGESEQFNKMKGLTKNSLKRALALIEELLESISVEAGEGMTVNFSEIDLMEYIKSLHFEASEIYANQISLESEGEVAINGIFDGAMIRRVLENFVSNAIKYGERNTPVKIIVNNSPNDVTIYVHNFGEPIANEKKEEIFQFLKTSGNLGGEKIKSWGIGLALVKAVVEAHGGKILLNSTKDKGTFFGIKLDKFLNKPGQIKATVNFS